MYCRLKTIKNRRFRQNMPVMYKMPIHYRKTVDRSIQKLINKQYPEDEFVLDDDDVIVLTKVDIRCNIAEGETDESDDDSENEFKQFYNTEVDLSENEVSYSDDDDFIDDRPEDELTEESDNNSGDEENEEEEEGREYNSESEREDSENDETENKQQSESEGESNEEAEKGTDNGNRRSVSDDNDDDDEIKSPRKKAKSNVLRDDDSSESSGEDNNEGSGEESSNEEPETRTDNGNKRTVSDDDDDNDEIKSPRKKAKSNLLRDDDSSESSGEDNNEESCKRSRKGSGEGNSEESRENSSSSDESTATPPPVDPILKNIVRNGQQKDENKFNVYLLPKIYEKRTCLRYHGRIGMAGIKGLCKPMQKRKFCDLIHRKRERDGFTRINLMYVNARHLENRKMESGLPKPVRKFLIHIIDQWFPVGIPLELHLNRAIDLLECLKRKINEGKMPSLKHSNKFYELIPHQGDCRRRPRFKDVELCDNKIKYVETMKTAIDCLSKVDRNRRKNPLDYFIEEWLRIELRVLEPDEDAFKILNEVVQNTQHPNSPRQFYVKNIFQVSNMNPDLNGDFSSNVFVNHRYLFHFSFASNLPCILREGLMVAPKHIHSINRFLGEGIYFWDAIANSGLNYKSLSTVYVLVCKVALGKTQQVEQQYLKLDETLHWEEGSDSIFCQGKQFSSTRNNEKDLNGIQIYCGQLADKTDNTIDKYSLYNEYVVRNKNQVIVDYIIKLEKE